MARRVTGGRARAVDASDDALSAAVGQTRRLGAHQKRVVLRLRRCDDGESAPWVTETVCFFFNAQGEVLRAHRAGDDKLKATAATAAVRRGDAVEGDEDEDEQDPIVNRSFSAKDAIEKERVTLWLADLHPSVEVVGFMVSYTTDQIARRPHLNAFDVTCDATTDDDEEEDPDARVSTLLHRETAPAYVFAYTHDRPAESGANYVVLFKMYRDTDSRNDWFLHSIGAKGEVRSSVNAALAEAMQVFLLDIIPEIEIAHRNALNTVASICAALNRNEVLEIEQYFREEGVTREEFTKLLLLVLLMSRPDLHRLSRVAALVALLFEMFEQIDINGDGAVDWEEFTTFCVSLGLIATKDQPVVGSISSSHSYHQQLVGPYNRSFPYQIRCIRPLPSLRIVTVIQNKCSIVLVYDTDMSFLYEFTHVSRLCHEDNEALAILDLDYIPMRNWMVVSSSDHSLTFWSVVNAITGAYVFAFKIGSRCPIPHLQWCGNSLNRLFTISSEGVQLWDIEANRVASRMNHHRDRITACVEIQGEEPLLATCSFDTTIAVLHVPSLTLAFHLNGHIQGVQQMDYHQRGGLLLSTGFEHQAYCWSIPGQCLITTLGGHQASLIGARYVSHPMDTTTVMAVVGDERGHFRLWDITRCLGGHSTELATPVQSFDIVTPNLSRFRSFACVTPPQGKKKKKRTGGSELFDVISGSFRLFRFHAVAHSDESAPPRHVTFNSVSNSFVGSVDGVISVWAGNSGVKLEEPITIHDSDICAIVFDMPRERKLFVATSDGAIRLYNPITAMLLTKTLVHDGLISSLIYCSRSACLISTGYDRRISIAHSSTGKTEIDVLRSVENAHDSCISAAAYSPSLELIATGDDAGNIHVYDFQRLYLLFRCEGHLDEIRALQFHYSAPTLFSGDAKGVVYVWHVATTDTLYQIQPMMQLNLACSNFFLTECRPSSVGGNRSSRPSTAIKQPAVMTASPVTSIVCTPESKHASSSYIYVGTVNGSIWGWDFRALTNHARKFGVGKGFEYRFQDSRSMYNGSKYNALLRVTHKTSVLKLRPEDVAAPTISGIGRSGRVDARGTSVVLESCEASCVWQAHASMITQLRELPYPGQLYSVSLDGTIKVWDMTHSCLGTITTIADPDRHKDSTSQGSTASASTTGSSSSWKYAYHHHLIHEAQDLHIRIGREMMQRVKRKLKKVHQRHRGSQFLTHNPLEQQDEEPELAMEKADTRELTPVLAAAEKLLVGQFPFSKESRRTGMQSGLYGAEEARMLRDLAQGPRKQHEQQVKSRLAPLMLASPKPDSQKKKSLSRPEGNEHVLPVMRAMNHFSGEVERRRAAERRAPGRAEPPDTSLSPFLRDKLFSTVDEVGPKSAPKKRPPTHTISLRMDASIVVTENVGLPLLQHNQPHPLFVEPTNNDSLEAVEESPSRDGSQRRLASAASAPCLYNHQPASGVSASSALASSPSMDTLEESAIDSDPPRVNNIERKMRLYEGLGVARTVHREEGPTDDLSMDASSRQHRTLHRQKSQPLVPVRQKAENEAARGSSNARKRRSQGEVGPTAAVTGSAFGNPYGPYYTTKQVVEFSAIIARFDADYSGDIDKSEWVHMMQSCKPIFGAADLEAAERLFHSIDRDDSGKISLKEILPMVFSKATPDQLQKMRQSIQVRVDKAAAAMAAGKAGDV